jgi:hypothetical protein
MPSANGILEHLYKPESGHLMRLRLMAKVAEATPEMLRDRLAEFPLGKLAKLHGELHRLDEVDAGTPGV